MPKLNVLGSGFRDSPDTGAEQAEGAEQIEVRVLSVGQTGWGRGKSVASYNRVEVVVSG